MPQPVDPASLSGRELDRWYRRSPQDVERERQAASDERYQAYFGAGVPETPMRDSAGRYPKATKTAGLIRCGSPMALVGIGLFAMVRPTMKPYLGRRRSSTVCRRVPLHPRKPASSTSETPITGASSEIGKL